MKKFSFIFSLLAMTLFVFNACQSDTADSRDKARASLTDQPADDSKDKITPTNVVNKDKPANNVPTGPTTTIAFSETTFDFGEVDEGEKVSHVYKFTNTGNEPLVISNAKGSCGCTVPKWPKDPIAVGESGEILVEFNSKGKPGKQTKRVTVTANTNPAQSFLTITGQVKKKETAAEPS